MIDARMTPLQRKRIEMLAKIVGPIAKDQLAAVPGNMGTFEASLPNQRMFGGLRDVAPPNELIDGRFMPWLKLRNAIVGYLGYQGDPGFLRLLELMFGGAAGRQRLQAERHRPVAIAVRARMPSSPSSRRCWPRWRRSCVSSRPGSRPNCACTSTTFPARIAPFLNNWGYARTRETALGNLRLMHSLNQQLHVPVKDCREAAEFLLAAKLVCPLGGQYVVRDVPPGSASEPLDLDEAGGVPAQGRLRARGPAGLCRPAAELVPRAGPARLADRRHCCRPTPRSSCSCECVRP